MPGEKQMVPGFNHNVTHKGTPYHVQTEDSGVDNPRIITHLFVGGNVIASKKTSYADIVGAENLAQVVRELMEEQHKEMLRNLVSGVYDDTDEEAAAKARAFQPGQIAPQSERSTVVLPGAPEPQRADPLPCIDLTKPIRAPGPAKAPEPARPAVAARPPPIPRPAPAQPQRSASAGGPAPERQPARPATPATPAASPGEPDRAAGAQRREPAPGVPAAARLGPGFGQDLISEKSLDEVILSYLAEDLAEKT